MTTEAQVPSGNGSSVRRRWWLLRHSGVLPFTIIHPDHPDYPREQAMTFPIRHLELWLCADCGQLAEYDDLEQSQPDGHMVCSACDSSTEPTVVECVAMRVEDWQGRNGRAGEGQ